MGSEILVIFTIQIFFGYIYFLIGLIATVFLAGLFPGACFGKWLYRLGKRLLLITDIGLIIFMWIFLMVVHLFGSEMYVIFFLIFGLLISVICGCQFPVALNLRGSDHSAITQVFSADLIGAAYGALVTSVILIPYLGLIWTMLCLIGLKTASLLVLLSSRYP